MNSKLYLLFICLFLIACKSTTRRELIIGKWLNPKGNVKFEFKKDQTVTLYAPDTVIIFPSYSIVDSGKTLYILADKYTEPEKIHIIELTSKNLTLEYRSGRISNLEKIDD